MLRILDKRLKNQPMFFEYNNSCLECQNATKQNTSMADLENVYVSTGTRVCQ